MNKNLFINIITALQEQYDDDLAKAYLMGKVLDYEANPYDNSKLSNAIFKLLRLYFKDKTSDIEIFCWEQNFGRMNDVSIEKLWDFLQEPTRMKNNWDDNENDAKYSASSTSMDGEKNVMWYKYDDVVAYRLWEKAMLEGKDSDEMAKYYPKYTKVSDDIKNIEVKDFVIISPLKKR